MHLWLRRKTACDSSLCLPRALSCGNTCEVFPSAFMEVLSSSVCLEHMDWPLLSRFLGPEKQTAHVCVQLKQSPLVLFYGYLTLGPVLFRTLSPLWPACLCSASPFSVSIILRTSVHLIVPVPLKTVSPPSSFIFFHRPALPQQPPSATADATTTPTFIY